MRLLFKQRFFSWLDSYNIYDEEGRIVYEVKGKLSWGHKLQIYDKNLDHVGTVKEKIIRILPKFEIYENDKYLGDITKKLTFLRDRYTLDFKDWHIYGDILDWNYEILDNKNNLIMKVSKKIFNVTDTYVLDIVNEKDQLYCLMIVLAIDAAKCSSNSNS